MLARAPHEHLEINAEDLREFYHAFVVGAQRQERNILQGVYKPDQIRHLKSFRPELEAAKEIVAALDTLAMGDTNAVAYGQVAHLALLLRTGHFGLEDFITLKNRPSRKKWHVGLMIDDFILVEICEQGKRSEEVRRMVEDVRAAYVQYGLPRHEGKAVEHSTEGEFWGAQLDGVQGILRLLFEEIDTVGQHHHQDCAAWILHGRPPRGFVGLLCGCLPTSSEADVSFGAYLQCPEVEKQEHYRASPLSAPSG